MLPLPLLLLLVLLVASSLSLTPGVCRLMLLLAWRRPLRPFLLWGRLGAAAGCVSPAALPLLSVVSACAAAGPAAVAAEPLLLLPAPPLASERSSASGR
jgi:hypothetical protein